MTNVQLHEMYLHIKDLEDDFAFSSKELKYLEDFLSWMDLWDSFVYFRMNAHLEHDEEEPFPRYVL